MPRSVDAEAVLADFEDFLVADGRTSHGTDFLTRKLAELRALHRVDESADAAVLRRFSGHLVDVFLGLVPRPPATTDPLPATDPRTAAEMDAGATADHTTEGAPCLNRPSLREPDSRPEALLLPSQSRAPAMS